MALIDGSGRVGRGVAYSTTEPAHLLNVRAEGMSAWAGEPDHFARRFEAEGGDPRGFAQRRLFGRYLGEVLDEAVATDGPTSCLLQPSACGAPKGIGASDSPMARRSNPDAIALATGNQEPEGLRAFHQAGRRYIANPWGEDARAAVRELAATGDDALIVGTGLTMIDVVLSLDSAGAPRENPGAVAARPDPESARGF